MNANTFGQMLSVTGAVVSGLVALEFFERDEAWVLMNIDIYCLFAEVDTVLEYMVAVESYCVSACVSPAATKGVQDIVRMEREGQQAVMCRSKTQAAALPITYFWGTALMNFLTASSFV